MLKTIFQRHLIVIIALFFISAAMAQEKAHWELIDVEVQTPPAKYESRGSMSPDNNVEVTYRLSRGSIYIQKKLLKDVYQIIETTLSSKKMDFSTRP